MAFKLDSKIPAGELAQKWSNHKAAIKVVSPANKRKLDIIVIGTGLGGASAAASLGELGYNVKVFCIQDSPRRAHSIAAQGGINAAKNYQNDNDSVYRLFYDTIKGGDYRAREANVYRLAEVSNLIIDQCVAQGVPFAREYGGLRLRQRLLPLDQRHGVERFGRLPVLPQGRRLRQPLLHADPPHLHPRTRHATVETDADVRIAA